MWVRKRIDMTWADVAFAIANCLVPRKREALQRDIEQSWTPDDDTLACLSIRTGFDVLLGSLGLLPGSEVLMSAANIAHMARLVERHGLLPVPIDLDIERMEPRIELLRRAITPQTRAIFVAHLFGSVLPLDPIAEAAKEHGLIFMEDCAQIFDGSGYRGHPGADVAMFSFGPIKTATAMGGAIFRVRDRGLLQRMRDKQAGYPVQGRWSYLGRLLKYSVLKFGSPRPIFAMVIRTCKLLRLNYDRMISDAAAGFPGEQFFSQIQWQPCGALLATLRRRLRTFDSERLRQRAARGKRLYSLIHERILCPGGAAPQHVYWVFPIVVDDLRRVVEALRDEGFDPTDGHSLRVFSPPPDRPELKPSATEAILPGLVYLPCYPEMPMSEIDRLGQVLLKVCGRYSPHISANSRR